MSSSKNTHLANGWEAFSYFCCSAWNDTYLIDISKATQAKNLSTQKAQFVPVTQIYTSIDNLMSQNKLYSVFEYPMAPDISSATHVYSQLSGKSAKDISRNLSYNDASGVMLNTLVSDASFNRLDNSFNIIGQGVKCKPKMSDCIKIDLTDKNEIPEYSIAVTPTRIPYFGQNQGNLVANTKPQRVTYIVSAELKTKEKINKHAYLSRVTAPGDYNSASTGTGKLVFDLSGSTYNFTLTAAFNDQTLDQVVGLFNETFDETVNGRKLRELVKATKDGDKLVLTSTAEFFGIDKTLSINTLDTKKEILENMFGVEATDLGPGGDYHCKNINGVPLEVALITALTGEAKIEGGVMTIHDFSSGTEKLKITYDDKNIDPKDFEWDLSFNLTSTSSPYDKYFIPPTNNNHTDFFIFKTVGEKLVVESVAKGKDVSITINEDSSNNVLTKLFGFDRCESKTAFGTGGDAQTEDSYKKEQMKIVSDPFLLNDRTTILINSDIDMESDGPLVSSEFGDVTVSYSYNWDITNNKPLSQSGALGSKYLVISCVPTYLSRDKRENVNILNDEFYGISPNGDTNISFGYVSYQSLGSKKSVEDNIKENNSPSGYLFPKTTDGEDNSVFAGNWFEHWVTSYGDLADAMQGKSSGGSGNFASKFSETNQSLAYSKLVNQTAVVNTNFLKKLLYIKKNTYLEDDIDSVNIYITVLEDWTTPANALDSFGATGIVNGAAYIPYLDVNASRQIVSPDYDIWNNGETTNPAGTKSPSTNYVVDDNGKTRSNHNTMVPHQKLDVISDFPKWGQENILSDSSYETNKDMLLFDWRAKTLAQPTFACCELDLMVKLGEESDSVRLDKFAGSYISNEFTYKKTESDYILDANEENIYKYHETIGAEGKSYVADKGTYVHGYSEIFEEQFPSKNQEEKLFIKFDPNKQVFKNDTVVPKEENIKMITSREKKIPWFTWEGLSLPMGTQTVAPPGSLRCILTKEAITALVSIIRTASLLITGMVMNHELAFSSGKVIDTITNKTLYIAWYNTNEFLRQLSDLPISNILNPEITSDFATDTIKMPNWLDVFKQADNIKIAQFFRSSLCKKQELERMIGPIDKLITSDESKNYPPPAGFRTDKTGIKTGVMNLPESYNKELHYYKIDYTDRNKITYPSQTGTTMAEDMFSFQTTTADATDTPLRGLLRPIMWDPSGSYPNHGLIPHASRGEKLGYEWGELAYISCDGTLRNNGNCLQKTALNYVDETVGIDGTPDIK